MKEINSNIIGVNINGTVYKFYPLSLGASRKMMNLQSSVSKMRNDLMTKYNVSEEDMSDTTSEGFRSIPQDDVLEVSIKSMEMLDILSRQFVDPDQAEDVFDVLGEEQIGELITALRQ